MNKNIDKELEFYKLIVENIPVSAFCKNQKGQYIAVSKKYRNCLYNIHKTDIFGKTDLDLYPNDALAKQFYEEDMKILGNGIGMTHTKQFTFDDELQHFEIIREPLISQDGEILGIIGTIYDITDLSRLRVKIKQKNIIDELTGVFNRSYLYEWIKDKLPFVKYPLSIFTIDCNGLKFINDHYSYSHGDDLLKTNVVFFEDQIKQNKLIFRLGGDEFLIIVENMSSSDAAKCVERMKKAEKDYCIDDLCLDNSYGVYTMLDDTEHFNDAMQISDFKMYNYKRRNR